MARLHEYQGKAILQHYGIPIPEGAIADSPSQAADIARQIGKPVVVKAQIWTTSRAGQNLIHFANTPQEVESIARDLLGKQVDNFRVEQLLIEEQLSIAQEFYLGMIINDTARAPMLIFSSVGGSGVEEIAQQHPDKLQQTVVDIHTGLQSFQAIDLARRAGISGKLLLQLGSIISRFYQSARQSDARTAEINPLAVTSDGKLIALDARFTIDDYAAYRHPEMQIEIAREFDRNPTPLEMIAWNVEKNDYRGTFYFIQMETEFQKGDGVIGFHGAGGGGSMMNMDELIRHGYKIANFVDTSGNPPASKVYRAARIILSQHGIDGYFAGGSGVASQEQFHSARGLVKAFMDTQLNVPAVLRVGGNAEDKAIEILERANGEFPAPIEAYGRDDTPQFAVDRLSSLIDAYVPVTDIPIREKFIPQDPYSFETVTGGTVTLDHARCRDCESKICIETCSPGILSLQDDVPVLNIDRTTAKKGGCTECLACEIECYFLGNKGGHIDLPIQGLND